MESNVDRYQRSLGSPTATTNFQSGTDDWSDADEIELGGEEHDLFLKENYTNQNNQGASPFRAISRASGSSSITQANGLPRIRSQTRISLLKDDEDEDFFDNDNDSIQSKSLIDNDNKQHSSIVHQVPNHQQFSNNIAPSNLIASFILITVILCVTILPIITLSQPSPSSKTLKDQIINGHNNPTPPAHTDVRCKCICPPPPQSAANNSTNSTSPIITRRLYVGNTSPNQCNCDNIVRPQLIDSKIISKDFCSRCECRYQSRNTTTIRRNVVFFIAVLSGLGIYMLVQYLFKFLKITRRNLPVPIRWLSFQLTEDS